MFKNFILVRIFDLNRFFLILIKTFTVFNYDKSSNNFVNMLRELIKTQTIRLIFSTSILKVI